MPTQPHDDPQDHRGLSKKGGLWPPRPSPLDLIGRIQKAKALYERMDEWSKGHPALICLCKDLDNRLRGLALAFQQLGAWDVCRMCALGPKGACCFKGAEEWYETVHLLVNMIMGVDLEGIQVTEEQCPFVGEKGCILRYKNEFCLDFFCDRCKRELGMEKISNLRSLAGKTIAIGITLEHLLYRILKSDL